MQLVGCLNRAKQVISQYETILDAIVQQYEEKYRLVMMKFPEIERYKVMRIFQSDNPIDVRLLLQIEENMIVDKHVLFKDFRSVLQHHKVQLDEYLAKQLVCFTLNLTPKYEFTAEIVTETNCIALPILQTLKMNIQYATTPLLFNLHPLVRLLGT
jgi:hypothetical protein